MPSLSQAASCLGISLVSRASFRTERKWAVSRDWHQPTCLPAWCQLQRRQCERQRAYQRRVTPLETEEKSTETETHSSLATVYACTVPGGRFPAKLGVTRFTQVEVRKLYITWSEIVSARAARPLRVCSVAGLDELETWC